VTALAALVRRDVKIALRVGGGALIGVLFFLTVVVLMPFALGPDLALLTRLGPPYCGSVRSWRACLRSIGCSWPTMRTARSI
jgi:heme exporter protein CcmB